MQSAFFAIVGKTWHRILQLHRKIRGRPIDLERNQVLGKGCRRQGA
ncbi:hypothetical protein MQE22_06450 [Acidithiobacillus sp. YTS05]|nr:hypothetical protein MQE22_06450 [Acidithiobacillus sp. YTS05]